MFVQNLNWYYRFWSLRHTLERLKDRLAGFITFAYKTGWRILEISGLTWNQVDLNQGIVCLEVGETKNGEVRTDKLDPELKEIIYKHLKERIK